MLLGLSHIFFFSADSVSGIQLLMGRSGHSFASESNTLTLRNYFPKAVQFSAGALPYSRIPRAGIKILPLGLDDRGSTLHLLSIPDTPISQSRLDHLTQVAGQVCCR